MRPPRMLVLARHSHVAAVSRDLSHGHRLQWKQYALSNVADIIKA